MTDVIAVAGQEADCGHWLPPGTRHQAQAGRTLCNLCAVAQVTETAQRQQILGIR